MFEENIIQEKYRTFKEIDNRHTMICIEDISEVEIENDLINKNMWRVNFYINNDFFPSKEFDTEEEALKFRNEIMGWGNDK